MNKNILSKYSKNYSTKEFKLEGLKELEQLTNSNKKVYDNLINLVSHKELLYAAYKKIHSTKGGNTKGITKESLDGINKQWFENTKKGLKTGSYQFKPARTIQIPKKNGTFRQLGIPSPRDKIVQESIRMVLEAIYEKTFSKNSHGFRKGRSCHTALEEIKQNWAERKWFLEGDISQCFDSFDHKLLIMKLKEKINDQAFIDLIYKSLKVGYINLLDGIYKKGKIGTPQGSIISPLLANIYIDEFDKYMDLYKQNFDKGRRRQANPEYTKLIRDKEKTPMERIKYIHKNSIPLGKNIDPNYKRLAYIRYADDFLIGIIGSKEDCEIIKTQVQTFLQTNLKLTLNMEKTLITNATKNRATFLGYEIHITPYNKRPLIERNFKDGRTKLAVSTTRPLLSAPVSTLIEKLKEKKFCRNNYEPTRVGRLIHFTDKFIVEYYASIWRGIANYYAIASNFWNLRRVYYILCYSCLLTLVSKNKLKTKKRGVVKYGMPMKIKDNKNKIIASFPKLEIPEIKVLINYDPIKMFEVLTKYTQKTTDSLNSICSRCGSTEQIEMHHKNPIKNIDKEKDFLSKTKIMMERKQIPLCKTCHIELHKGKI